ncbi:unnamed protein product [Blepharisma stoltei]|uniref:Uncharacterized protein n=1 Tax=Blepharisma stoltei TaxID=1481888 RepID=A0AAU9KBF7_9CILI|nr:unnamed protein product [Blepharisma stoltei]
MNPDKFSDPLALDLAEYEPTTLIQNKPESQIKVPEIEQVLDPPSLLKFIQPPYYIRFKQPPPLFKVLPIKYELTEADLVFLKKTLRSQKKETIETFGRSIDLWEKLSNFKAPIPKDKALEVTTNVLGKSYKYLEKIYDYWLENRKENGHSILREFWKGKDSKDQCIKQTFMTRKHPKMELRPKKDKKIQNLANIQKIVLDLKKIVEILMWIRNKETVKKTIVTLNIAEFEQKRADILNQKVKHKELDFPVIKNCRIARSCSP